MSSECIIPMGGDNKKHADIPVTEFTAWRNLKLQVLVLLRHRPIN